MNAVPRSTSLARALTRSGRLLASVERRADRDEPLGAMHTAGNFLHLVVDTDTGEYLAPVYSTLVEQLVAAHERLKAVRAEGHDPWGDGLLIQFRPFPDVPRLPSRSPLIALVDSGVLANHPLLRDRVVEVVDFTGEGVEDRSGHGTIQAIRQVWHEPRAKLVIVKAFGGPEQRPTLRSLALALDYLVRLPELGFVFVAGGIDTNLHPQGKVVCAMADQVAHAHDLGGGFVATRGNIGNSGEWCPAMGEEVRGITVVDRQSLLPGAGPSGGIAIPQTGPFTSFPEIDPQTIPDFHLTFAEQFADDGHHDLAVSHARKAMAYERTRVAGADRCIRTLLDAGRPEEAEAMARAELARTPDAEPRFTAQLGRALHKMRRHDEALVHIKEAIRAGANHPDLMAAHGECLEIMGFISEALDQYRAAAVQDASYIGKMEGYAYRQLYSRRPDAAVSALHYLLEMDPTLAITWHNLGAAHALRGDPLLANQALTHYADHIAHFLDTSVDRPTLQVTRNAISLPNGQEKRMVFAFVVDGRREDHRHYARAGRLLGLVNPGNPLGQPMHTVNSGPVQPSIEEPDVVALVRTAARILLLPAGSHHRATANALAAALGPRRADTLTIDGYRLVGQLFQRLQDMRGALQAFLESARRALHVDARRRELALVNAARLEVMQEQWSAAEELLTHAYETSLEVPDFGAGPHPSASVTYRTPAIHAIRALLALRDGDLVAARVEAEMMHHRQPKSLEAALVLSAALAPTDLDMAHTVMRDVFRAAHADKFSRATLQRWLEDFPLYDRRALPGTSVLRVLEDVDAIWTAQDVVVTPHLGSNETTQAAYSVVRSRLEPAEGPLRVAVIGAGLAADDEFDDRPPARVINLTAEPDEDPDGVTSGHCMALLSILDDIAVTSVIVIKAVGASGGSISALCRAFLMCAELEVNVVFAPLDVEVVDYHLLGIIRQTSEQMLVIAAPSGERSGTCYPGMAEEFLLRPAAPASPPPRSFAVYAHPTDYPEGYVLREWLYTPHSTPGRAWSSISLEDLRTALPDGAEQVSGQDPGDPTIIEVWM